MRRVDGRRGEPAAAADDGRHALLHHRGQELIALRRRQHPVRVRVAVHETRRHHQPGSIDRRPATQRGALAPADTGDPPSANADIRIKPCPPRAIHESTAGHHYIDIHHDLHSHHQVHRTARPAARAERPCLPGRPALRHMKRRDPAPARAGP
jgi:hypothetical protein